nr:immunoglobulin light chain junction region [Macaca mulatta]MOW41068.1 immunoglobulin light chain junction region [Macaca mulatta]MOW41491.1 immunoglobulin light chain junction region [Macaca mulatta]MOW42119.1 immunoglobulin light chain junction region [Macaca mulatta]MOW42128.1 immunoglobulin light chain junction region [Macaca mulatta]
CQQAYRKPLTF